MSVAHDDWDHHLNLEFRSDLPSSCRREESRRPARRPARGGVRRASPLSAAFRPFAAEPSHTGGRFTMTPIAAAKGSQLFTPDEIESVASQKGQPQETLSSLVRLIRERFESDVCSVYLIEPDRANLVLTATVGL